MGVEHEGRSAGRSRGQALILVAVMMTALLGMVAMATDTGLIWINRRGLQNAADAAALAGAKQLPDDTAGARTIACDYATTKNAVDGMTVACEGADIAIYETYRPNDTITVTTHKTYTPFLGSMFGWPNINLGADATALLGSIQQPCPFPIFQTPDMMPVGAIEGEQITFYVLTAMHLSSADNQSGNFLTVDVGSGADDVFNAMVNNTCSTPIGPTASTEPGGKIGKVVDGFQWRVACAEGRSTPNNTPACPGASACPNPDVSVYLDESGNLDDDITRSNCTRLVIIPIFPGPFDRYNGKTTVTILGFAVYYVAGVCPPSGNAQTCTHPTLGVLKKGDSWGYYVRMEAYSPDARPYDGFGTKVVLLIE